MSRRLVSILSVLVLVAATASLAGCGDAKLRETAESEITATLEGMQKAFESTKAIGEDGGPEGTAAVQAIDDAEKALVEAQTHAETAKTALKQMANKKEADAYRSILTPLEQTIMLYEPGLADARAIVLSMPSAKQIASAETKLNSAIKASNNKKYADAEKLGKQASALFAKAEGGLVAVANQYPDSGLGAVVTYCQKGRELSDLEANMDGMAKRGQLASYNKYVKTYNAKKKAFLKMKSAADVLTTLNDRWIQAYNDAMAAAQRAVDAAEAASKN